tara:strand:+ start:100 stop:543 length:444 start_codon:yes stop_codon:yes gene_type:complete
MGNLIICDIDGTIANNDHRQNLLVEFKDWDLFFSKMSEDLPIKPVIEIIEEEYKSGKKICFLTGRPERYRGVTSSWIEKHLNITHFALHMRQDYDHRDKISVKREMFEQNFNLKDIDYFVENDKDLIKLWEENGTKVLDVNKFIQDS